MIPERERTVTPAEAVDMSISMHSQLQQSECPRCKGHFTFRRAKAPHFDNQGFESYQFDCKFCGASLTGIVDPSDGALLLAQQAALPGRPYGGLARKHSQKGH